MAASCPPMNSASIYSSPRWRAISITSDTSALASPDRKSTRLNSSHGYISYAVFCLKKKKEIQCQAGAGIVKVQMTCKYEVTGGTLDPTLDGDEQEMLDDLDAAELNDGAPLLASTVA